MNMPIKINTLVAVDAMDDLPAIYRLLKPSGIARWSLFSSSPWSVAAAFAAGGGTPHALDRGYLDTYPWLLSQLWPLGGLRAIKITQNAPIALMVEK
jgi:hypothetical protein